MRLAQTHLAEDERGPRISVRWNLAQGEVKKVTRWVEERGLEAEDEPSYARELEYLVLGIVYLMTAKPALGGSLLVLGIAVILGLVVSLPGWRMAGRGVEKGQEKIGTAR